MLNERGDGSGGLVEAVDSPGGARQDVGEPRFMIVARNGRYSAKTGHDHGSSRAVG
jgi:hypothetical protein